MVRVALWLHPTLSPWGNCSSGFCIHQPQTFIKYSLLSTYVHFNSMWYGWFFDLPLCSKIMLQLFTHVVTSHCVVVVHIFTAVRMYKNIFVHVMIDRHLGFSIFLSLLKILLWIFLYKFHVAHSQEFLWSVYLEVEWLGRQAVNVTQ